MKYILLLRGINVGGKHKVVMAELKDYLSKLSLENVSSYINSGNLFFETDENIEEVKNKIAVLLEENYEFEIPFALISGEKYLSVSKNLPEWWYGDLARRDVLFYTDGLNIDDVEKSISSMPLYNEEVYFSEIGVFWAKYDEKEFLKTSYHKNLIKENYYKYLTIRNGNTFEKIKKFI